MRIITALNEQKKRNCSLCQVAFSCTYIVWMCCIWYFILTLLFSLFISLSPKKKRFHFVTHSSFIHSFFIQLFIKNSGNDSNGRRIKSRKKWPVNFYFPSLSMRGCFAWKMRWKKNHMNRPNKNVLHFYCISCAFVSSGMHLIHKSLFAQFIVWRSA